MFLGVLRPVGVGSQNFTSRSLVRRGRIQAFARLGPPSKYTDLKPVWGHAVKPWSKAALRGLDLGGTTVSTETVGTATSCVLEVSTAECLLNSLGLSRPFRERAQPPTAKAVGVAPQTKGTRECGPATGHRSAQGSSAVHPSTRSEPVPAQTRSASDRLRFSGLSWKQADPFCHRFGVQCGRARTPGAWHHPGVRVSSKTLLRSPLAPVGNWVA